MSKIHIDIFCQVIDNFGDAGVCLRLARQLSKRGHMVRIYTDKPEVFKLIYQKNKFSIYDWNTATIAVKNGLVIEAFACELPEQYKKSIKDQNSIWVNLEYLSAENWVNDFHGLPSPQADGTNKYFFFPGFNKQTGGLLRDEDELETYRKLRSARIAEIEKICQTDLSAKKPTKDDLFIFLFCYPNAPLVGLQQALASLKQNVYLMLIGGSKSIPSQDNVNVINVPFIEQTEFDSLLWLSDINFIRGEDSLAQASWCPTPMAWQAYVQTNNTHMDKLSAWISLNNLPKIIIDFIIAWNQSDNQAVAKILPQIIQTDLWSKWQIASAERAKFLCKQTDLVSNLEQFYHKKLATF